MSIVLRFIIVIALHGGAEAGLFGSLFDKTPPPPASPPHIWVHVALRTYTAQNLQVIGTIGSLYGAAQHAGSWLTLTVAVLNTGQDGKLGHAAINATIAALQATLAAANAHTLGSLSLRPSVHESVETYGYVSSDVELSRVMRMSVRPDYILFANGDTLYAQEIFSEAKPHMMRGVGIIGMNWQPTTRHLSSGETKYCAFEQSLVDLNGLLFRVHSIRAAKASFAAMHTPCPSELASPPSKPRSGGFMSMPPEARPRRCRNADDRPYWVADWGLAWQVIEHGATHGHGGSTYCLKTPRPQFLQN